MRLLLIDDEVKLCHALAQLLMEQNVIVDTAHDGVQGLDMAYDGTYDLLVVDVMLPGLSGFDIVRTLRENKDSTPVLLLTARDGVRDRVTGLDSGADDYLVKPFASEEFLARVRALTRRVGRVEGADSLRVGPFELDLIHRSIAFEHIPMNLTAKEFQLMELFLRNAERVLPKIVILDRVWGTDASADVNAVEIYVHMLRKKIAHYQTNVTGSDGSFPFIETVRGVGYRFRGA